MDDGKQKPNIKVAKSKEHDSLLSNNNTETKISAKAFGVTGVIIVLFVTGKCLVMLSQSLYVKYRIAQEYGVDQNTNVSNRSVCQTNDSAPDFILDTKIQKETSTFVLYLSLAANVPTIFSTFFLGAYSDYVGRKMLLIVANVGCALQSGVYALISHYDFSMYLLFIAEIINGLSGNFFVFLLAMFAFTTDITSADNKKRTLYIATLDCLGIGALGIGNIALGYVIKYVSFAAAYLISSGVCIISLLIIIFFATETGHHDKNDKLRKKPKLSVLLHDVFGFYFSKIQQHRSIMVFCFVIQIFCVFAHLTFTRLLTLFLLGRPICWNAVHIGIYTALINIVPAVGTSILVRFTQKCIRDTYIAFLSAISHSALCFAVAFSQKPLHLYIALAVGSISVAVPAIVRSEMSKIVPHGRHGSLYASLTSAEAVLLTFSGVVGNALYGLTASTFTGTIFVLIGGIFVIGGALTIVLDVLLRRAHSTSAEKHSLKKVSRKNIE